MSLSLTFEELMKMVDFDIEGATIVKAGNNDTDHYISIKKDSIQYDCIRRDDGKFINWSRQITI